MMRKLGTLAICTILAAVICIAQDVVSVVHGTVKKVDHATKTIVVKTANGTEHTIKVTGDTAYKGTKEGIEAFSVTAPACMSNRVGQETQRSMLQDECLSLEATAT
jgi:hypothetical protein